MTILTITPAFTFIVNINIETLLETHIYSTMTLIMLLHSFIKTTTRHCCNKSYKIPIGVYMIQSQHKAIRYLPTWTLKLCHTPCILLAIQVQLSKLIMFHIKLYSTMIKCMFSAQLMDNTPIQVFIDNGATPSILPLSTYNKHPIL